VETYLAQRPTVQADAPAVLDLIYNEIVLREETRQSPQLEEYLRRFPELDSERAVVALHRAVAAGYGDLSQLRRDSVLDPLRPCRDFQDLMMDLSFPSDPFQR
jgi:hypothetical protein